MNDKAFVPPAPPVEAPEEPLVTSSSSLNSPKSFTAEEKAELLQRWQFTTDDCFALSNHCNDFARDLFDENKKLLRKSKGWIAIGFLSTLGFVGSNILYTAPTRRVWRIRNPQHVRTLFFTRIASGVAVAFAAFFSMGPFPFGYPALVDDNKNRITKIDEVSFSAKALAEKLRLANLENEIQNKKPNVSKHDEAAATSIDGVVPFSDEYLAKYPLPLPFDESLAFDLLRAKMSILRDKSQQIVV